MSSEEWKKGIAFVKGINMFGNARITKNKMLDLCKDIENENIRVERIHRADNIVFKKRNVHYATVGQKLEGVLSAHFEKPIHVTTRSFKTIKNITKDHKTTRRGDRMISFRWFGQACLEMKNTVTIVTDPHDGSSIGLEQPDIKGDIVSISHQHFDHASGEELVSREDTEVIEGSGKREIKGIRVEGIDSFHDKAGGSKRGENTIFVFELDDFRVCHLGDLGHKLSSGKIEEIKPVDILLIPIGGNYTINAQEAVEVIKDLEPKIVIPMHYKVKGLKVNISGEEEFLQLVKEEGWGIDEENEVRVETLPKERKVFKLTCQTA